MLSIAMCYTIRAMSRTDMQVNFRMPAELKAALEAESKKNHRSLTAEIVARLQDSLAGSAPPPASESAPRTEQDARALVQQLQEVAKMIQDAAKWLPKKKE